MSAPLYGGMKAHVMSSLRWSVVAKFGAQLLSWVMTLLVIRLLMPQDYGLVAMLTLLSVFLAMFADMGFGASLIQSPVLAEREVRQTFGAALIVNGAIAVALAAAAPLVADFYGEPRLIALTHVASLGFVFNGLCVVPDALIRREMRFKLLAGIDIASTLGQNLAILVMAWLGFGVWALMFGGLVGVVIRFIALYVTSSKFYRPIFSFRGMRKVWAFGSNVTIARIISYWSQQVDVLIAGKLLGKEALGFYTVAVHLATLPMQRVMSTVNSVAFPAFASIQHDKNAVATNVRLGIRLMALITFPVLWGIASIAPELVRVAVGPNWAPAILPLTIVAFTVPVRMIGSTITTMLTSVGRVDVVMITTLIGALVMPPIFYAGSRYGIEGLSFAWLAVTPLMFGLNMVRALPALGLSVAAVLRETWRPVSAAFLMTCAVYGMREVLGALHDVPRFFVLMLTGASVYCLATWLFNRATVVEALTLLFPGRFAGLARPCAARS